MDRTRLNCLTAKANAAFEQATTKIVERAKQTGTPVVVWEDDAVQEVQPEEWQPRNTRMTRKKKTGVEDNHE